MQTRRFSHNGSPYPEKTLLIFLAAGLLMGLCFGCTSGTVTSPAGTQEQEILVLSGKVSGLDPGGGAMELFDMEGNPIPLANTGVSRDGTFSLEIFSKDLPQSPGYVLAYTKQGKNLRALVLAWNGTGDFSGEDSLVSPFSEAAFLLCSLTQSFNFSDYIAFLKSCRDGVYDFEAPETYGFSFRDIFNQTLAAVQEYLDNEQARKPDKDRLLDLLENQGHVLDTAPLPGQEDVRFIKKALVSENRAGLVFLTYPHEEAQVDGLPALEVLARSQASGNLSWTTFSLDLGNGLLGSVMARAAFAPETLAGLPGKYRASTPAGPLASGSRMFTDATGQVGITLSNAGPLVDSNACGLEPEAGNTRAAFKMAFKEPVTAAGLVLDFYVQDGDGKNKTRIDRIPVTDQTEYHSIELDLTAPDMKDRIILVELKNGDEVLYSVSDTVDITRYQAAGPMIAMAKMSATRAKPTGENIFNNIASSNDTSTQPIAAGNVATHYVLDLDRFLGTDVMPLWDNTDYGKNPIGDGSGRIPLIIIHGWQGGFGLRDAAKLSLWENSPVRASRNWIEYYLSKPELQNAFHLYYVRWPSYKHLEFSSGILTGLLAKVKEELPGTDLAAALSDPGIGVAVITHSTGGLIARSAIETHGAFAMGDDRFACLRKAILMASPNHGTPVAVNTYLQDQLYDIDTQASGDLEWDSFDGNADIKFDLLHFYDYKKDRASRWNPNSQNLKAFDSYFLNKLGDPGIKTYNPWLVWFNRAFEDFEDRLADKYVLYSGWLRPDFFAWKKYNTLKNGAEMDAAGHYLAMTGYQDDGVLTVSSNLFAANPDDKAFNPTDFSQIPTRDWYPQSTLRFTQDWNTLAPTSTPAAVFGNPSDHPRKMAFRILWDYDHLNTRAGAVNALNSFGSFDDFVNRGDVIADDVAIPSIFLTEDIRRDYIRWGLEFLTGADPGFIQERYNPLRFEPIFLCVEKDLISLVP